MKTIPTKEKPQQVSRVVSFLQDFGDRFVGDQLPSCAASLAYYTTLSIASFTVIILISLSLLGPEIVEIYTREVTKFLGVQASSVFVTAVTSTKERPDVGTLVGILSILTLLISSSAVFGELRDSMNRIHRIEIPIEKDATWLKAVLGFIKLRILNAGLVLGFIFILVTPLILSSVIDLLNHVLPSQLMWTINYLGSGLVYVFTFLLLTRYVPSESLPWGDSLHGGLITGFFSYRERSDLAVSRVKQYRDHLWGGGFSRYFSFVGLLLSHDFICMRGNQ